jgi:hypothetical protein
VKRCSLGRFFASGESTRQVLSPKGHNGGITLQITDFINTIDPDPTWAGLEIPQRSSLFIEVCYPFGQEHRSARTHPRSRWRGRSGTCPGRTTKGGGSMSGLTTYEIAGFVTLALLLGLLVLLWYWR